ncbi:uncharacterized protein LOC130635518 [Hydractinia symbiolongicarpus]|uniref:uncharacterized protein LOC130635518 n=1 Tax=Hydractinia symbiolongicarpus TaxID=13093 RepID=UPI00254B65A8|nr:uncharacterized protein LOC130635518 [Hydractinia symbiolongicarpus]
MRKDFLFRAFINFLYIVLGLSFVSTLIMMLKEFHNFGSNWNPQKFIHPRWLRHFVNMTYEQNNIVSPDSPCFQNKFQNILLIVSFGAVSEYESIPLFELLYKKAFTNRIYCGASSLPNQTEITILPVDTKYGAFLYDCLDKAIKTYTNYSGYLFIGEDVLLNYWNVANLDQNKIWEDDSIKQGPVLYEQNTDSWEWWQSPWGSRAMEKVYEYLIELNYYDNRKAKLTQGDWKPAWDAGQSLNKWLWNGGGEYACYWTNRSVFYIPQSYSQLYVNISKHFRASGVRHNIAIPTVTRLVTLASESIKLRSLGITENNRGELLSKRELLVQASDKSHFIYIDGNRKERRAILNNLRLKEYAVGKFLQYRRC